MAKNTNWIVNLYYGQTGVSASDSGIFAFILFSASIYEIFVFNFLSVKSHLLMTPQSYSRTLWSAATLSLRTTAVGMKCLKIAPSTRVISVILFYRASTLDTLRILSVPESLIIVYFTINGDVYWCQLTLMIIRNSDDDHEMSWFCILWWDSFMQNVYFELFKPPFISYIISQTHREKVFCCFVLQDFVYILPAVLFLCWELIAWMIETLPSGSTYIFGVAHLLVLTSIGENPRCDIAASLLRESCTRMAEAASVKGIDCSYVTSPWASQTKNKAYKRLTSVRWSNRFLWPKCPY